MKDSGFISLDKNAKKSMLIADILSSIFFAIIFTIVYKLATAFIPIDKVDLILKWVYIFALLVLVIQPIALLIIGVKHFKYYIDEHGISYIHGLIFVEKTVVPIRRIQQIEIEEGPINKIFNLVELKVVTAGGDLEIECLKKEVAEKLANDLRIVINEFIKEEKLMED